MAISEYGDCDNTFDAPDNLVAIFENSEAKFGENPLIGEKDAAGVYQWTTYREISKRVDNLRSGLAAEGVKRGDKVGIIANNRKEWLVNDLPKIQPIPQKLVSRDFKLLKDRWTQVLPGVTPFYGRMEHGKSGFGGVTLFIAIALFLLVITASVPASAAEAPLKKVALAPMWSPQAQFAGYYVALDKGIYASRGIDLSIIKAGPGISPVQALKDGKADFAVLWLTTAIRHRSEGLKLVNLAQIIQRSAMMLITRKSSNIDTIAAMNGRSVGMWGGDLSIPPHALFSQAGVKVREVPLSHTVNLFLRGGIDATSAMWYNEYHTILNSGVDSDDLNLFFLNTLGMNFPEDGIYAMESAVLKDPVLTESFVEASLDGWRYAFAYPEEALDIVVKYMREAKVPAIRVHQRWMLEKIQELSESGHHRRLSGRLQKQDYEAVCLSMRNQGIIRDCLEYSAFCRRRDAGEK